MATKHEHPLNLVDLWSEQLQHEEESEEEEEDEEANEDEVIAKQDFKCMCSRCDEEINWVHRYYYTCGQCKVCRQAFPKEYLWIYKCEKCRYYTHLNCATSRNEPFMSILTSPGTGKIIKNYEDAEHPNLLHLPFPDPSYSLLKHLFFKENGGSGTCKTHDISHQHPLTLVDAQCGDITIPTSSRIKPISYHDPMKRIQLLCDGCVRPITSGPIYVCTNEEEHCNFVLHEWCSRLPAELKDHPAHQQHTLLTNNTSRNEPFMSILTSPGTGKIIKNYEAAEHPNLLHLPFPDPSYSLLKHLFFKENGGSSVGIILMLRVIYGSSSDRVRVKSVTGFI
ncbi:hypothetical protein HanIR_Chr16g0788811 [Helianthus annuus]|nr:hypothetical protein HanIR_Chr16g0788811 [Helianthus annuus]